MLNNDCGGIAVLWNSLLIPVSHFLFSREFFTFPLSYLNQSFFDCFNVVLGGAIFDPWSLLWPIKVITKESAKNQQCWSGTSTRIVLGSHEHGSEWSQSRPGIFTHDLNYWPWWACTTSPYLGVTLFSNNKAWVYIRGKFPHLGLGATFWKMWGDNN